MSLNEKIKVLYVDDEINNLFGFKASFRFNYKVLTANNTTEALDHLNKNPDIRIIFCDQRMPDKTGVQFFEEIRDVHPHPIRMLLTGYADLESVIDAINRSNIFRYVKKPWVDADIISAVEEGNRYYLANSQISLKNDELQRAYDELDKFAYSVTHDIRGPLLSVLGAIDIAQYITDLSEMKDLLNLMENSVKNLDKYIQNMHDYYNLRRGELQIEEINFQSIIQELEETYRFTAKLNQVHFTTKILQQEAFRCDKMSIMIILNNLLSNAFKYQNKELEEKTVELDIKVATGIATIYIRDNGVGIPEKYSEKIFGMFFRANTEEVGSGFGLYNVKDALRKLNGKIKVDSVPGKGSVFTVTIPNK